MAVEAHGTPTPAAPAAASEASGRTGANAQTTDPGPTPSPSPESPEQDARGPDFFRQAFMALRSQTQETHDLNRRRDQAPQAPPVSDTQGPKPERPRQARKQAAPATKEPPATTLPPASPGSDRPPQPSQQETISLTPDQFNRRVQSEVDRILAKQQADERTRQMREEEQRLRDEDPFEYVRAVKAREAEEAQTQTRVKEATGLLEEQLARYDRGILDPLVGALPEPVRKQVLESVRAEGIPGRAEVAKHALGALKAMWQAEGRESARKALMSDQTFIKEVLARYGGQANGASQGTNHGSPEVVTGLPPASSARSRGTNEAVNDWMRSASTAVRSVSGRR